MAILSRAARRHMRKNRDDEVPQIKKQNRNPVVYGLSIGILGLVTISFIAWPVVTRWRPVARYDFGSYAGNPIVYVQGNYFASQYDTAAESLRRSSQDANIESQLYQAFRYAFNQTVLHLAILDQMHKAGAWVSDERVSDSLVEYGPYVVNGTFDNSRYERTPQAERTATRKLRREELLHDLYLSDMFATSKVSDPEKKFITQMAATERRYAFVAFKFSDLPDSRVISYGLENEKLFRKMKLSRITIRGSKREAEQVRARVGSSSFDELARSYSKDPYAEKGGDLGWQYYHQVEALFGKQEPVDAIFALKEGEVSPVLESGGSFVFFRADSAPVNPDFRQADTVKAVRDYILSSEVGVAENYFLDEGKKLVADAKAKGFNRALADAKLFPPQETEFFPVNYGNSLPTRRLQVKGNDQSALAGGASDEEFLRALTALPKGGVSDPLLLGDRVIVASLLEERPMPPKDLELLSSSMDSFALQALQQELPQDLIDSKKLDDHFQETFFSKVLAGRGAAVQ
jgi:peptidyl-prolyl cis-trans isomerase D